MILLAYIRKGARNVIMLDWSKLSGSTAFNSWNAWPLYQEVASANINPIGQRLVEFLEKVKALKGIGFENVTLVGASMGAHSM